MLIYVISASAQHTLRRKEGGVTGVPDQTRIFGIISYYSRIS